MYIDMGERIPGKQDRSSVIIEGPTQASPNGQRCKHICIVAHIWKTYDLICDKVLLPGHFGTLKHTGKHTGKH